MASEQSAQRELFGEIYVNNWSKLLRYAKANKSCAGVAEELVQDTFHDAWSKFNELVNHENIGGWLMQTLKNKMRNYTRASRGYCCARQFCQYDHDARYAFGHTGVCLR